MVEVLVPAGMVTMAISHPYYFGRYTVTISSVNLVKDHGCSDSAVIPYVSVKYYSFGGSDIRQSVHTFIHPYEGTFHHKLVYYSILTP